MRLWGWRRRSDAGDEEYPEPLDVSAVWDEQLSAHLDLSPLRKLKLLQDPLPERAQHLAEILRSRCQVLDTLLPFRHLAAAAEYN